MAVVYTGLKPVFVSSWLYWPLVFISLICPVNCILAFPASFVISLIDGMVGLVASAAVVFFLVLPLIVAPFTLDATPDFCFLSLSAASLSFFLLAARAAFLTLMALNFYLQYTRLRID